MTVKNIPQFLVLITIAGLVVWGGITIFQLPAQSQVAVFRVFWVGFIPVPIPVALFTSPHFWGGLVGLLGLGIGWAGIVSLKD